MLRAVSGPNGDPNHYCHACFSGDYAIPFTPTSKKQMRLVGV
jgi:hypothetical protein